MEDNQKILENIWEELKLGVEKSKHPYHIFSVSTANDNKPDSRCVVLRNIDKKSKIISFHTDIRSKKIKHINSNDNVCALFYDHQKKIQLRIYGEIYIVTSKSEIEERWKNSRNMSKLCYLNKYPPGDPIRTSKEYLCNESELGDIERGMKNFSIINVKIETIDWLNLNHKGHERMIINFYDNSKVNYKWVAP